MSPQISSKTGAGDEREYTDPAGSTIGSIKTGLPSNRRGEGEDKSTELDGRSAAVDPPGGAGGNLEVRFRKFILVTKRNVPTKIARAEGASLIGHALLWT